MSFLPRTTFLALAALAICSLSTQAADLLAPSKTIPEAIDHYIDAQLKEGNVKAAPQIDDATFIRRVTLDLLGRIPTATEVTAYTQDKATDKRVKLIDRLLASPAFVRHQATEFDAMLSESLPGRSSSGPLRSYLLVAFKENRSWDKIFRDLIEGDEKDAVQKGSRQFLIPRLRDLDRLTTDVSVLFFGVNISCAQCHDHPLVQDWKQDHFYGLKAFLARSYQAGQYIGERDYGVVQFKTTKNVGKTAKMMFLTGKVVDAPGTNLTPAELKKLQDEERKKQGGKKGKGGATPPPAPKFSARKALVDLVLQAEQREFFSRNIVNQLWYRHMGMGLVSPIDQMHSENHPSHPELLAWLARDMANNKYDIKRMIRGIVMSKAYSRSSKWDAERWPSPRLFAVAKVRPLTPMQLAMSLKVATAAPDQFPATLKNEDLEKKLEQLENSARGFANVFERPRDDFQISVMEALLFSNSDRIDREFLTDGGDKLLGTLKKAKGNEELINTMMLNVLGRKPSNEERTILTKYLEKAKDKPAATRQMVWALLTGPEFRFNY